MQIHLLMFLAERVSRLDSWFLIELILKVEIEVSYHRPSTCLVLTQFLLFQATQNAVRPVITDVGSELALI